jgi:hypothetical protein
MTPEQLRKIDELIADILGWKYCKSTFEQYQPSYWAKDGKEVWPPAFHPSTDMRAAWLMAENLKLVVWPTAKGRWLCFHDEFNEQGCEEYYFVSDFLGQFTSCGDFLYCQHLCRPYVIANTAPLAICITALLIQGIDINSITTISGEINQSNQQGRGEGNGQEVHRHR